MKMSDENGMNAASLHAGPHQLQLRPLAAFKDEKLERLVRKHWGSVLGGTPEEKLAEVRRLNNDLRAAAGKKVFDREGCSGCHPAPFYSNNKLTLAKGWTPSTDHPYRPDMLLFSVGTEPAAALQTRKATGLYKVPSLKGLWYRNLLSHDGSVASLEEMFDPDRLQETHVPGGWMPLGTKTRRIQGHEFGLKLQENERQQLIAFLRSL